MVGFVLTSILWTNLGFASTAADPTVCSTALTEINYTALDIGHFQVEESLESDEYHMSAWHMTAREIYFSLNFEIRTGVLSISVSAKGQRDKALRYRGFEFFDFIMNRLKAKGYEVQIVRGLWQTSGRMSDNYSQFEASIRTGMSREAAALNTWTGQQVQRYGFNKVTRIDYIPSAYGEMDEGQLLVLFTK